jgi:hypothetical protein
MLSALSPGLLLTLEVYIPDSGLHFQSRVLKSAYLEIRKVLQIPGETFGCLINTQILYYGRLNADAMRQK